MPSLAKILHKVLWYGQPLRFNLTPNHFYSEIPDLRQLRGSRHWRKRYPLDTVNGSNSQEQIDRLTQVVGPNAGKFNDLSIHERACIENAQPGGGYGPIEALVLHCDIIHHKPAKVVQIGCGVATSIILSAAASVNHKVEVQCVEPYPSEFLRKASTQGRIRLIDQGAQVVDQGLFDALDANDLLFIDSTHTIKVGSEVVRVITEILPRLTKGVRVHFHDITWPYDYGGGILDDSLFFWRESLLLWAYLMHNPKYSIDYSMTMLHADQQAALKSLFPAYTPCPMKDGLNTGSGGHYPSSTYLRVIS